MCKVSDRSEMVGVFIGWFHMELPISVGLLAIANSDIALLIRIRLIRTIG